MQELIAAALHRRDHRAALGHMAEAWASELGRFCAAQVGSRAEAEELLQDTFIEAWTALPRLKKTELARPWLYGIARLRCAQHLRRRDRRADLRRRFEPVQLPAEPGPDAAIRAEERRALSQALAALTPPLREAVLLRFQAGLSGDEMAAALGIRAPAARKRVSLALAQLRRSLRPLLYGADHGPQPTPSDPTLRESAHDTVRDHRQLAP